MLVYCGEAKTVPETVFKKCLRWFTHVHLHHVFFFSSFNLESMEEVKGKQQAALTKHSFTCLFICWCETRQWCSWKGISFHKKWSSLRYTEEDDAWKVGSLRNVRKKTFWLQYHYLDMQIPNKMAHCLLEPRHHNLWGVRFPKVLSYILFVCDPDLRGIHLSILDDVKLREGKPRKAG